MGRPAGVYESGQYVGLCYAHAVSTDETSVPKTGPDSEATIIRFPVVAPTTDHSNAREAIGMVLREERHAQRRTLADVAEHAAVSLPYLSEVERGRKDVSSELLHSISGALRIEVPEVLERAARILRAGSKGPICLAA